MKTILDFVILALLLIAAPITVFGHSTQALTMESKTVVFDHDDPLLRLQNGSSFFEARIFSNYSALMVSTVIVETNTTNIDQNLVHNISGVSVYPSRHGEPIIYSDLVDLQWFSGNKRMSFLNSEPFPISIPKEGILGVTLGMSDLGDDDQVRVTFVYLSKPESEVTTSTIPVTKIENNPLDITTIAKIAPNPSFIVDDAFSNPEIHCELCAKIVYNPKVSGPGEAVYIMEEMHLEGVSRVQFWARGEEGGETLTFKAAGKRGPDGEVSYTNTTQVTLGQDWTSYEIDVPSNAANLSSITHIFAFETSSNGNQSIYLKGITYR